MTKRLIKTFSLVLVSLYFCCGALAADALVGVVTQVKDGNKVTVSSKVPLNCVLYGIDAPEIKQKGKKGQPYSQEAKKELEALVLSKKLKVELKGTDPFGRNICLIKVGDTDINFEMIKRGAAWAARDPVGRPFSSDYLNMENKARALRVGLWATPNPMPPWEFRNRNK